MYDDSNNIFAGIGITLGVLFVMILFFALFFVRFQGSQSEVSGIVYNTSFNHLVSGKTMFSVRASVDTFIYHDQNGNTNESSYCLPKNSPYTALIKKAADDKNIKVVVTSNKYFAIQSPFTCHSNVIVREEK